MAFRFHNSKLLMGLIEMQVTVTLTCSAKRISAPNCGAISRINPLASQNPVMSPSLPV